MRLGKAPQVFERLVERKNRKNEKGESAMNTSEKVEHSITRREFVRETA
jgi:hypothetical protein